MLRLITLAGTRPELIKMSLVLEAVDMAFDHTFVHTGQNYDFELSEVFFSDLGIRKPDYFLGVAGGNASQTISNVISKFDEVLEEVEPDAMLLLGDTNSGLAVISAKRRKIPIFHMEAGNRCFDQRVPEEINRKIIDHTSDINLVYTEHARRYLLAEGVRPEMVIKTGSPMPEVLGRFSNEIDASPVLDNLDLEKKGYFLVSAHREENVDTEGRLSELVSSLEAIADEFGKRVIFSVHPRTRNRLENLSINLPKNVDFLKPLGFFDYVKLQKSAFCVISDSGTITEESALLGLQAITIRDAHERPEGMDEGTLIMSDLDADSISNSVRIVRSQVGTDVHVPSDYRADNVSLKVVRIIQSYTSYVNRVVWFKSA